MFIESFKYITTDCKPEFRRLGYLHESIALEARYRRLHDVWNGHVQQCQDLIRLAVEQCEQQRKVVVLGSGLLAEIPLEFLSERFDSVVLVDVVHLKSVRKWLVEFDNIELVEADISGLSSVLLQLNKHSKALPTPEPFIPSMDDTVDLIVSANLLSQIYVGPLNFAVSRTRLSDEVFIEWCQMIINAHMQSLIDSGRRVCLITDHLHEEKNRNGDTIKSEDVLFGVKLPDSAWHWEWQLAPLGEISRNFSVSADVTGFINFPLPMY
ncbi:MAG: hypothetical protein OEX12_07330 [Gammaproteobacteria bacterium]|nr:hypothetical protein [Gammaproteobacteria bacterium]